MNMKDIRGARAAENQSIFRTVNERITDVGQDFGGSAPDEGRWVCECVRLDCAELLGMTIAEYEAVRADPTHFIVAPDDSHVVADIEVVIERNEGYWVVEKVGAAAKRAEQLSGATS
jgi:hypothetical protein